MSAYHLWQASLAIIMLPRLPRGRFQDQEADPTHMLYSTIPLGNCFDGPKK